MGIASAALPTPKLDGESVMLNPRCNRRDKSRTLLILPVSIGVGYTRRVGIIRDISPSGMFLYSDFAPPIGAEIELKLVPHTSAECPHLIYRAIVVRLTSGVTGAAVGMGLSVIGVRAATALQSMGAALQLREVASHPASSLKH